MFVNLFTEVTVCNLMLLRNLGGHPSDNLSAILAVADHLARQGQHLTVRDVGARSCGFQAYILEY